jgi:hypothetical protein
MNKPVAWLHTLDNTEGIKENEPKQVLSFSGDNPFGIPGRNYDEAFSATSTPLWTEGGVGKTMSQTTEIKPGLELNLAVLKALGAVWRDEWKDETGWKMAAWYYEDGSVACRQQIPQFSTDLNAAFAAAEKAGLFSGNHLQTSTPNNHCAMLYKLSDDLWHVSGCCGERYSDATTPALAICAAILKVKG